jgi:hypothetical protein
MTEKIATMANEAKEEIIPAKARFGFALPLGIIAGMLVLMSAVWTTYMRVIRPWQARWGATDEDIERALPGDDFILRPNYDRTRAITIDAPASAVWPWLVQMGQGRGGMYSYEFLENAMGLKFKNADHIIPELQDLKVGDVVPFEPGGTGMDVVELEKEHHLLLKGGHMATWLFLLEPLGEEKCRLIVRFRARINFKQMAEPELSEPDGVDAPQMKTNPLVRLMVFFLDPGEFIMQRKMLLGIKERAERVWQQVTPTVRQEFILPEVEPFAKMKKIRAKKEPAPEKVRVPLREAETAG